VGNARQEYNDMAISSTNLQRSIANLQADFENLADRHPWLCVATSPSPIIGVLVGPPGAHPGFLHVEVPAERQLRVVVDHAFVLTHKACQLLNTVLQGPHRIPADIVEQIQEWEKHEYGYGWYRWVMFAATHQYADRYENYAQVAAGALYSLRDWSCSPPVEATLPPAVVPATPPVSQPQAIPAPLSMPAPTVDREAQAIALLWKQPTLSLPDIAKLVGVDRPTVYRWPNFLEAAQAVGKYSPKGKKEGSPPRGSKDKGGNVEAWHDEAD
jgi:hypothetical protein